MRRAGGPTQRECVCVIVVLTVAALMLAMSALPALAKAQVTHSKEFGGKSVLVVHEKNGEITKLTGNCRLS